MAVKSNWTTEMDARLTALHADGISFAGIAETMAVEFHVKLTKNAAIGRAHRLKLENRKPAIGPRMPRPPRPAPEPDIDPNPEPVARLPWKVALPEPLPGVRLAIWDLRRGVCHFPIGDRPPYAYCGITSGKSPYCALHRRVMYAGRWRVA